MKRQKRLWTAAAACAVLGAACRAVPGVRFAGLLFWCLTALLIVFAMLEQYKEHAWAKWGKRVLLALVCLGLVAFGYLESLVIRGAHTDGRAEDAQCVVILGAGVNGTTPSLMLSSRLQAALDFIADIIYCVNYLPVIVYFTFTVNTFLTPLQVTVILAVPFFFPFTTPLELTVAILLLLDL